MAAVKKVGGIYLCYFGIFLFTVSQACLLMSLLINNRGGWFSRFSTLLLQHLNLQPSIGDVQLCQSQEW